MSVKSKIMGLLRKSEKNADNIALEENVAISVEHLTMEFKISKDKIDTLKEYIIRTLKRNKKEKEKVRVLNDLTFKVYKGDKNFHHDRMEKGGRSAELCHIRK